MKDRRRHTALLAAELKMGATNLFLGVETAFPLTRIARTGHLSGRRLQRAIDYIHAHLSSDVRIEHLATAAGLSVFHFARTFKKTTGLTPYGYLMMTRVERAKVLLLEYDKTLAEIASELGFSDQSHMSNVFKRFTGATPRKFRVGWERALSVRYLGNPTPGTPGAIPTPARFRQRAGAG